MNAIGTLMAIACVMHAVQLPLYPVNIKWLVAMIGAVVYGAAAAFALMHTRAGLWLSLTPIIGGIFVIVVYLSEAAGSHQQIRFNIFTLLATIVEIPATALSIFLLTRPRQNGCPPDAPRES